MGTMIGKGGDVVEFLENQHEDVKVLFKKVLSTSGELRKNAFKELCRTLDVHEAAEEEIVHPAARTAIENGPAIVEARLREEKEAKQELAELKKLDLDTSEFDARFRTFEARVLAHADAEEKQEFARIGEELEPERLARMREAVEHAEAAAAPPPSSRSWMHASKR